MKLNIFSMENSIEITADQPVLLEVADKKLFIRLVETLYTNHEGLVGPEEMHLYDDKWMALSFEKDMLLFSDVYHVDLLEKKIHTAFYKKLQESLALNTERQVILEQQLNLLRSFVVEETLQFDFDVKINENLDFISILKAFHVTIDVLKGVSIFEKSLAIIDVISELEIRFLCCFTNLRTFLTDEELETFFKYVMGKKVKVLLVEFGLSDNEQKSLAKRYQIDNEYDEFVL